MFKPWHSFVFGASLLLLLALLSKFYPADGISLTNKISIGFPTLNSLFSIPSTKKDISKIIHAADSVEAIIPKEVEVVKLDSAKIDSISVVSPAPEILKIEKSNLAPITSIQSRSPLALKKFFEALIQLQSGDDKKIRVLHYGDSQIEGDRITDYLRLKLQKQFGGEGPGLLSLMPIAYSVINKVYTSKGWDRYNAFAGKDKRVLHNNYGVLASFNRFNEYKKIYDTSVVFSSSVSIATTPNGGTIAMSYKKFKLFYGGTQRRTWCEFYDGPALMAADSLDPGVFFNVKEFTVGNGSFTHSLKFRGKDSPDFYAISLEGEKGIMVDNIALRGSSGTFFHHINPQQLKQFYSYLNVKLIILQFGGNALPSIQTEEMAKNYAGYLKSQIAIIKKAAPNASILFVGPSDMSIKQGISYETYPLLETLRDAIKKVVLESDCAFYDMYDSMGGYNSMPSWVDKKLAASDYTHFSPQGARKMASLFYAALISEYNNYLNSLN